MVHIVSTLGRFLGRLLLAQINFLWDVMKKYDPTFYGFAWADEEGTRFQMEPLGYRGYIEARPCKRL
jgi:hypothetical protein